MLKVSRTADDRREPSDLSDSSGPGTDQVAVAKRALNEEPHCGDQCDYWYANGTITLAMVDGLGHGKHAETAAVAAIAFVSQNLTMSLDAIFHGCNAALSRSRGAAMGIAAIELATGRVTFAGIGNTRARIFGTKLVTLNSQRGIVGGGFRRIMCQKALLHPGDILVMFTDGIRENMKIANYEAILRTDANKLAHAILSDWSIATDDAAVLVFRKSR